MKKSTVILLCMTAAFLSTGKLVDGVAGTALTGVGALTATAALLTALKKGEEDA